MELVQVNDKKGKALGNVSVGDTKQQALERLSVGDGGLFDKYNRGLLNSDLITVEGAPYVFKPKSPALLSRIFCRHGRQSESMESSTRMLERLEALAAELKALAAQQKALATDRKAMEIKSLKAAGDYFVINCSIWKKKRIQVNDASGAKEAAALIAGKINEWNAPFRALCKMPPLEEIKEEQWLEFERLKERNGSGRAFTNSRNAAAVALPPTPEEVIDAHGNRPPRSSPRQSDNVSSVSTGDRSRARSSAKNNNVVREYPIDILPVPDPNWRLEKIRNQIYEESPMNAKAQNIFRTLATTSLKDASPDFNSLAHAAPIDLVSSVFWGPFLPLLTGEEKGTDVQHFFAINGLWKTSCTFGEDFQYHGIKNIPQNLLALPPNHGSVFDGTSSGNLIIIPIIDLQSSACDPPKVYGINSHFDLLVIAKSKSVYHWIYHGDLLGGVDIFAESIDAGVEEATEEDIKTATKFLELYVKAAAHIGLSSMKLKLQENEHTFRKMHAKAHQNKVDDNANADQGTVFLREITNQQGLQNNLEKVKDALNDLAEKGVWVPNLADNFVFKNNKVLKVRLKTYFDDCSIPLKYYPSWSLLGLKAAANWLVFAEQPFIPSCRDIDAEIFPIGSIEISSNCDKSSLSSAVLHESDEDSVVDLKPRRGPLSS